MKAFITLILIAASAYPASTRAENDLKNGAIPPVSATRSTTNPTSACPSGMEMTHQHLQGVWRAQLDGTATGALLRLGPHPELGESVRGSVQRASTTAQVSGDVHEGELTLEESTDGQRISAVWEGEIQARSCGRVFRGLWRRAGEDQGQPFVLTRLPSTP